MRGICLAIFAMFITSAGSMLGQTTVTISDSSGNQTHGTISGGSVYFFDSNGKQTFGTIRNGQVFLNTSDGEMIFGTIKNESVFLTDSHGITTGTIRNGRVLMSGTNSGPMQTYCTNVAGNIACTTYDQGSSTQSYCSSVAGSLSCTTYSNDYNRVQIRDNYEAGQVFGTALGNLVMGAIGRYRANKRTRQAKEREWNQFVQDTIASEELACETDPKHEVTVVGCRTMIFTFNQFLHRHEKDFVPDGTNVKMLADALDRTAPADQSTWTEQSYEAAFETIDKKRLDKKIYLGLDHDRRPW